jgi:hypothetical protein
MWPEVHKYMDQAQPYLQSNHRKLFHDTKTIEELGMAYGEEAAAAAYFHAVLDAVSDLVGQERSIAMLLELMEKGEI